MSELYLFTALLGFLWFIVYWIFGGVFFAVMAILRLGRVRKVRFSCLFSLLALVVGVASAFLGVSFGQSSIRDCLVEAGNKAEAITAIFGCGFAGIFGVFLLGAAVIVLGGFVLMSISTSKTKPWIIFEEDDEQVQAQNKKDKGFFD